MGTSSERPGEDSAPGRVFSEVAALPRPRSARRPGDSVPGLFLLLGGYALADFLGPILLEDVGPHGWPLVALWIGAVLGQIGFLAIWAALGPFRLGTRWLLVLATAFVLYFAFCFGVVTAEEFLRIRNLLEMGTGSLLIPLLFLVVQIPLWIRRAISGWRIVPADEAASHSAAEARQFGLAHILGLMALLAVSLSLVHVALAAWGAGRVQPVEMEQRIWLALGAYAGVFCLYVAVWTGPCLRACFLARDKALGCLTMVGVWLGVSVLAVVVVAAITAATGHRSMPGEAVGAIFLHLAALAAVLMGSLHALRACGYTMIRTGRKADQANVSPSPPSRMW